MKIAKFWAKARAEGTMPDGRSIDVVKWGWSDLSLAEAQTKAADAVRDLFRRVAQTGCWPDKYGYGSPGQPLREELVAEHRDAAGQSLVAVTRNAYGALVLNAASAMFIDIDSAEAPPAKSGGFLSGLFGRKAAPAPAPAEPPELELVRNWAHTHPDWSLRVYGTKAGLRVLVTHTTMAPESDVAMNTMRELRADPLYVKLCRAQKCFRARLTPKPWRIGIRTRPPAFPQVDQSATRMAQWRGEYDRRSAGFATCTLLAQFGAGTIHPAIANIVRLHDTTARIDTGLPLA